MCNFIHIFWVIVWLLKSEQIWTELRDSFLHWSGAFRHWKGSRIYQCLSKKTKNPESYYYTILVVSQRLCLSTVPAFALYMCHPFHCAFLMKLSQAGTMRKTHENKFVVKLYCGFLSLQLDAMSLPLSLSLPTETCGINTPYVSSSFLVQLCLTKVHLKRIYKKARDCVF